MNTPLVGELCNAKGKKRPDFRLDESGSDAHRADFQAQHPDKVRDLREAEQKRPRQLRHQFAQARAAMADIAKVCLFFGQRSQKFRLPVVLW